MKKVEVLAVLGNWQLAPGIFSLTLKLPECKPLPGQFVMLYLESGAHLLPRPISICDVGGDQLRLVYQVVGAGTQQLSALSPGAQLRMLGPLGNGFALKPGLKTACLVGGGIGSPPLLLLAKELTRQGVRTQVFLGFRDRSILSGEFAGLGCEVNIATDSGREGFHGNVIALLREKAPSVDELFSCGPKVMLSGLASYARDRGIPCQVSLEERMACGLGACVGCVAKAGDGYKKVCCDGPVFYSDEVVLDEY